VNPSRSVAAFELEKETLWQALAEIPDPEMPIVNLVELGIIREVSLNGAFASITITPTFSACPAYKVMKELIVEKVEEQGAQEVEVIQSNDPPWTSDWITADARAKLKSIGLTPPSLHQGNISQVLLEPVECPHCNSDNTSLRNSFGTTPCRMIYTCNNCSEPFEFFKPL